MRPNVPLGVLGAAGLNLGGDWLASTFALPMYLDTGGTVLAVALWNGSRGGAVAVVSVGALAWAHPGASLVSLSMTQLLVAGAAAWAAQRNAFRAIRLAGPVGVCVGIVVTVAAVVAAGLASPGAASTPRSLALVGILARGATEILDKAILFAVASVAVRVIRAAASGAVAASDSGEEG